MGGGASPQTAGPTLGGPYRQIILFGDSLTEQSGQQQYLDAEGKPFFGFAFLPAVQNCYNTTAARMILPQFMPKPEQAKVSLVTIFFGANDSALRIDDPSNQHVPLDQYMQNLSYMIHDPAITDHKSRVLLIAPPPVDEYLMEAGFLKGSRKASITRQYAEACCKVAAKEGVEVLDLWSEMMKAINWDLNQPGIPGSKDLPQHPILSNHFTDGLHFSEHGYSFFFGAFITKLRSTWPELEEMNNEEYDAVYPLWRAAMSSLSTGAEILPRGSHSAT